MPIRISMTYNRILVAFFLIVLFFNTQVAGAQVFNKQLKQVPTTPDTSKQKVKPEIKGITPVKVEEKKPASIGQIPFHMGNENIQATDIPKSPVFVTNEFNLLLNDNSTKISRRGAGIGTFHIVKRNNGGYVLAYTAESENQSIYAKGVMFDLDDDLKQIGLAKIFTLSDESISGFDLRESPGNHIGIAYLCKVATIYDVNKQPVDPKTVLKRVIYKSGYPAENFKVDEHLSGYMELIGQHFGGIDDTRIYYNKEDKGKISLNYGGSNFFNCDLQALKKQENFGDNTLIHAKIKSFHDFEYNVLVETSTKFNSVIWNLEQNGFSSSRSVVPSWPFLLVEPNIISPSEFVCRIENDPYTPFKEDYEISDIVKFDFLSNGNLIVLESQKDGINRIHYYNSRLEKINNGIGAAPLPNFLNSRVIIDKDRILTLELENNRWLALVPSYKDQMIQYRAIVYDFQDDAILWSAAEVLWEEPDLDYRDMKLLKLSDKKVLISYIDNSDYPNSHQQTIKFRILNLNF